MTEEYLHQERMDKGECDAPNTGFGESKLDLKILERQAYAAKTGNATYVWAVTPDTVLELIAELRAKREKYTNAVKTYKAVVQEAAWLAFQVYKPRRRCPPLQECSSDDLVTENDCQQCWLNAAREAVEGKK